MHVHVHVCMCMYACAHVYMCASAVEGLGTSSPGPCTATSSLFAWLVEGVGGSGRWRRPSLLRVASRLRWPRLVAQAAEPMWAHDVVAKKLASSRRLAFHGPPLSCFEQLRRHENERS